MSEPTRWQDFQLHRSVIAVCLDYDTRGVARPGRNGVAKAVGVSLDVLKRLERKSRLKTNGLVPIGPGPNGYSMTPSDVYLTYTGHCTRSKVGTANRLKDALEGADERYPSVGKRMAGAIADADNADPTFRAVQDRLASLSEARRRAFAEKVRRAFLGEDVEDDDESEDAPEAEAA